MTHAMNTVAYDTAVAACGERAVHHPHATLRARVTQVTLVVRLPRGVMVWMGYEQECGEG